MIFTTIHKFLPETKGGEHSMLSNRRNIVVIADEAHRSQYEFGSHLVKRKDGTTYVGHGFAKNMRDALPHASFIGFTGTPIELQDANTRAVFGDYISVYDIQRAVEDCATVPIYYESRLAKLTLEEAERPKIDPDFEEATEGEEVERKEKLKSKWAQLEAVVGSHKRLEVVARDIVEHFEKRLEAMDGKAMTVCMSRRICVELYRELVKLRPAWHDEDDARGAIKVVMAGSASDPAEWQQHIRNKPRREALANRFRNPADPLRIVLVRDMWLTGFDAPSLHSMYVDKPMRGLGLMQAIARVNRVFKDKPGGLVVDYLGLAHELKQALATYTESGGTGRTALDQDEAVAVMLEKNEVCSALFHGFDRTKWTTGTPQERLSLLPPAQEHILAQENGKDRCIHAVRELSQAFALAVPHEKVLRIRDDVAFFQAVQAVLAKRAPADVRPEEELDHAVRQIISRAVAPDGVMDIFAAAGLKKPDISILSPEVPEPRHRGGPGDRRADPAREGDARGLCARRAPRADRGRARLLRRPRDERQRGEGARRRNPARHRPRAGRDRAEQRHHRLDVARERARPAPGARQAHSAKAWVSARQGGESDADGAGAGCVAVGGMGNGVKGTSNNSMQRTALRAAADAGRWAGERPAQARRLRGFPGAARRRRIRAWLAPEE